ncbi:histidinol-phosphate aminotransferase [Moraxella macacae 0408225]|uniref:Histidinol-phosphate aminotransferase n=1 Tax=Moraxella macacae 0408225 TaxID=1230338 RepID=L2F526_9GAMM|nr:histidinol-phosphate transaminase [Moraxella macacae]ELA08112.1 histidinol-phosphate aminotransferase [Moraxella macacae 0408225]
MSNFDQNQINNHQINSRLWSNVVKNLNPYTPGEQPKHADLCKLNTNENPFAPSPKVVEAITQALSNQANDLRLYPAPESDALRETLADVYQLDKNQIFVGNGSDEVLAHIFACFFVKNLPILTPDIGYSFYPVYANTFGVNLQKIALKQDFSLDINDYNQPNSGIIFANPNAPTGILLSLEKIKQLLKNNQNSVVVVDEAYIDFAENPSSAIGLIHEFDNLIVSQTFSKSRSLAGLRVGMAFANPSLIEALNRYKNSFNSYPLDRLAQVGATASLQDHAYFQDCCKQVIALRQDLVKNLMMLGFHVLPSQANFVFAKPPSYCGETKQLFERLRNQGVITRHFDSAKITDYLRITVGTQAQNQRLINALQEILNNP